MSSVVHVFGSGVEGLSREDAARQSSRSFVRSEGQLAVYEESRNPTGHVLTAWEAFTAYGFDVLEEAVEYGSAILKRSKDSTSGAFKSRMKDLGLPHRSVGRAAKAPEADVAAAESAPSQVPLANLERISFVLGLDERLLGFKQGAGGDFDLAYRLRTLQAERSGRAGGISAGTVLLFAEAASIIRVQLRLQKWLGIESECDRFKPHPYYGSPTRPAWNIGYELAENARETLGLADAPIDSMRELVERRLGIPVIQARLPRWIAGATVMTIDDDGEEARGVVLNTVGENNNVWIRRATLAHELGHLLYDPDTELKNILIDSYSDSHRDPESPMDDFVEQRANAFAISFLAPNSAVRELASTPISGESVSRVMQTFGISHTAARYHIANSYYRQFEVPSKVNDTGPSDEQTAVENFTIDYFPLRDTPYQRRGRFCDLVVRCYDAGIISEDTAVLYLGCLAEDFRKNLDLMRSLGLGESY